jgi:hypothetical protein
MIAGGSFAFPNMRFAGARAGQLPPPSRCPRSGNTTRRHSARTFGPDARREIENIDCLGAYVGLPCASCPANHRPSAGSGPHTTVLIAVTFRLGQRTRSEKRPHPSGGASLADTWERYAATGSSQPEAYGFIVFPPKAPKNAISEFSGKSQSGSYRRLGKCDGALPARRQAPSGV